LVSSTTDDDEVHANAAFLVELPNRTVRVDDGEAEGGRFTVGQSPAGDSEPIAVGGDGEPG
jgi:hypothetical protein